MPDLIEAIVVLAFCGLIECIRYLAGIRQTLARAMEGIRQEETRRSRLRGWELTYYTEIQKELPEEAREELEEIVRTKIFRWVERYEGEIRRLPAEARQTIYEIAETDAETSPAPALPPRHGYEPREEGVLRARGATAPVSKGPAPSRSTFREHGKGGEP